MSHLRKIFFAGAAILCVAATDLVEPPTTVELERWTNQVPPAVMKTWLATMPPGSSPEDAVKRALANPEILKRLRIDEEIQQRPLPTSAQIDRVERALSHEKCVGNLEKWARRYSFAIDYAKGHVDGDIIWFSLREAGRYGFRSGRQIGKPLDFAEVDDRQFMIATGTYYLTNSRLKMDDCGLNRG